MAKRKITKVNRRKDFMGGNSIIKYVLTPCIIVVVASCIFLVYYYNNKISTTSNVKYIESFMSSSGQLRDYSNKIGMHDPEEDIKWYKTNKEIRIEFGRIYLTWEPEEFFTKEVSDLIETIGFTTTYNTNKDGEKVLKIYYQGVEVERWVK